MNEKNMKARGRSSSQRSIYDYPEHLNPFYEDENHKRLRFWKIDGLKNFWSFKTFKLKKKSSTLGINKTSESPPLLVRRHDDQYDNQSLANGQLRHTIDIGLESSFQRGTPNRSSLQDLSSRDNFIRNNRYRSTVQASSFGPNRYQSNPTIGTSISKGHSQLSVNSNPFDEISEMGSPDRSSIRHSARKKRRAPPPPISPNKTQLTSATKPEDSADITNLTAEIESFVRIADTDKEMLESKAESSSRQSLEQNTEEISIERIQNLGEVDVNSDNRCKSSPIKILVRAPTDDEELEISTEIAKNSVNEKEIKKGDQEIHIYSDITDIKPVENQNEIIPSALIEEFIIESDSHTCLEVNELKITESLDDLTTTTSGEEKQIVCETKEKCEEPKEYEPCSSRSTVSSIPLRNNKNDRKPPTPPQRRSVREIIESINKCQSLLKINQDQKVNNTDFYQTTTSSSSSPPSKTFNFIDRNVNDSLNKDYENKRFFTDMTEVNNNSEAEEMSNIPLFVEKFNELNNNKSNVLFEKCVVNPVPKPRRHRNNL